MTNGQVQQLRDLSKCSMERFWEMWVCEMLDIAETIPDFHITKGQKTHIHTLTHLYRHQIAAIRKNQHG